ncbi:porin PorA family protein [Streptomyces sp. NPDC000983]|uniref:porin PorA family protein n=1 Tax=Streptomyces sp. NPDC000983 TaxID=3154373 RepID=UPI003325B356
MRKSSWILSGSAVVLLAASAVTRFTVYPALHQVPAESTTTFRYQGTATMLNAAALQSGEGDPYLRDLPVTLDRRVVVEDTDGRTAVVSDAAVLRGPDGTKLSGSKDIWAVDRRTLADRPVPAGSGAAKHHGLVIAWPLEPEQRDYQFWDTPTQRAVPARYTGTASVSGRSAYVYSVEASGRLTEAATLESLPKALPREAVAGLSAALPADQRPSEAELAALPDTVPLTFTSDTERRGWVDADTGLSLNGALHQRVVAQTEGPDGPLALFPVTDVDVKGTTASVRHQADEAATAERLLWLLSTAGPLGLLGLAVVLTVLAVWIERRRPAARVAADENRGVAARTA